MGIPLHHGVGVVGEPDGTKLGWHAVAVVEQGTLPALALLWVNITYPSPWYKGVGLRLGSIALSLLFLVGVAALYYQDYASVGRKS